MIEHKHPNDRAHLWDYHNPNTQPLVEAPASEFPRMVYRTVEKPTADHPGYETLIVEHAAALEAALADGYRLTP